MNKRFKLIALTVVLLLMFGLLSGCSNGKYEKTVDKSNTNLKSEEVKNTINVKELSERLGEKGLVIVDIRSIAEYNGWKLNGEKRGGHIKGAVDFPFSWIFNDEGKRINDDELKNLLKSKGITSDKTILLYDTKGEKVSEMVEILRELGYKKVLYLEGGLLAWALDESLPMDRLANYEKLVYAGWINDLINGKKSETYRGKRYKIFEVSWGKPKDYNKGHIPGAIHLDTNEIEKEPLWNKVSDEDIEKMLLRNGITYDTTVILYGADNMAAARAASIMMYAGVKDVRLLDGGFKAWLDAGFEIETKTNKPTPVKEFGVKVPAKPEYIIDIQKVKSILADKNAVLVSVRSWEEYIGKTKGYSYIKPKGHIAGAVWGHAGSDPYHMEDYRNIDNTMRNFHEIAKNWEEWGITPDKKVVFYCGTGWRASEAFFAAYLMGWKDIAVYDGGWYEWSMDKSNPIEVGEPKNNK
ncbi:rhodanese-like domain-containing protein [Caminicella sporogenes]|uniref:rhodanese-like domain-containing protein n=1 Tax=Caminicella sporogenes TaxID=166485 RepID=UPI0025400594|nr:rhodanese-like domain-containing protein [Caminicella sporogenes]WIF95405.1 rhodanese-like domain-containing protein [Caminicella sporogenes]